MRGDLFSKLELSTSDHFDLLRLFFKNITGKFCEIWKFGLLFVVQTSKKKLTRILVKYKSNDLYLFDLLSYV